MGAGDITLWGASAAYEEGRVLHGGDGPEARILSPLPGCQGPWGPDHRGPPYIHIGKPSGDCRGNSQAEPAHLHGLPGDRVERPADIPAGGVQRELCFHRVFRGIQELQESGVGTAARTEAVLSRCEDRVPFPCARDAVDHNSYPYFPCYLEQDERP